jgi:hypothetical protein
MLLPCPKIPGDRPAVIRAERACTHTTNPCGDGTINFLPVVSGGMRQVMARIFWYFDQDPSWTGDLWIGPVKKSSQEKISIIPHQNS